MSEPISIMRRFQFAAGHRVHLHESKCANPHGHNYVAYVWANAPQLDSIGRVIDFSVLKQRVGDWIDANWDHGFIYSTDDGEMRAIFRATPWKSYEMMKNPTAENMAQLLLDACQGIFHDSSVKVFKVELWETENCRAEVSL